MSHAGLPYSCHENKIHSIHAHQASTGPSQAQRGSLGFQAATFQAQLGPSQAQRGSLGFQAATFQAQLGPSQAQRGSLGFQAATFQAQLGPSQAQRGSLGFQAARFQAQLWPLNSPTTTTFQGFPITIAQARLIVGIFLSDIKELATNCRCKQARALQGQGRQLRFEKRRCCRHTFGRFLRASV